MGKEFSGALDEGRLEKAIMEAREILAARAKVRGMMSYSELASKMTSIQVGPRDPLLHQILDRVSTDEHVAGRGMLSCIVVHKVGDMEPGEGFYELAARLGKRPRNRLEFWVTELHHVHAAWENSTETIPDGIQASQAASSTPAAITRSSLRPPSSVPAMTRTRAASTSRPRRVSG
jgi:hypothetical protein